MSGPGKRRALPDVPTMRDVVVRRATPVGRSAGDDQDAYFRLSLFSAEKTRILQRLNDLQSQQGVLRKRLDIVEIQMRKLQSGLGGAGSGVADAVRSSWNEIELEY